MKSVLFRVQTCLMTQRQLFHPKLLNSHKDRGIPLPYDQLHAIATSVNVDATLCIKKPPATYLQEAETFEAAEGKARVKTARILVRYRTGAMGAF